MSNQCMARRMKDKDEYKSSRAHSPFCFWYELRCSKTAMDGQKLCSECSTKIVESYDKKTHKNQGAWVHGLVNEPIPEWSFIFDGPEYHKRVSKYGAPSEQEMAKAKKQQEKARENVQEQKQDTIDTLTESVSQLRIANTPKPKRAPRKKETHKNELINPVASLSVPALAYESKEIPLNSIEVYKIQVKRFIYNDKQYYLDPIKHKVYHMGSDKLPGSYVGRWDPTEESLDTHFPDSDAE